MKTDLVAFSQMSRREHAREMFQSIANTALPNHMMALPDGASDRAQLWAAARDISDFVVQPVKAIYHFAGMVAGPDAFAPK